MQEHTPLWFLFQYKAHSNQEMLNAAQAACNDVSADEMHALVRILNHTYVVDQIFSAHLRGETHFYENTNTPETPQFGTVAAANQCFRCVVPHVCRQLG